MTKKIALLILSGFLFLAGCSPLVQLDQPSQTGFVTLKEGESVGQTLVARYDGWEKIAIFMRPAKAGEGTIRLHLRTDPQSSDDLGTSELSLDQVTGPGYYRFQIPLQNDSAKKYYYVFLELVGDGSLHVGSAPGDAYLNGALYQEGQAQDSQIAFRLIYNKTEAAAGLLGEGLAALGLLAAGIFLFIVPGWALLSLLFPTWNQIHWGVKLGISAGISLTLYPILFLWTNLIGLHLGFLYAWIPPIIAGLYLIWKNRSALSISTFTNISLKSFNWYDPALLIILFLIFATRFWVIRTLDAPMWGDSYHHTMIAQLLVDNGGLFNSWKPYADSTTFTYHFGFHTLVAVYHWITNLPIIESVLWVGQILNGLAVISLYPLAVKIGRSQWAGIAALVIAGLISPMPMYYVNWGRYTQLAGQVILPGLAYLVWITFESNSSRLRLIALSAIGMGGLALTHYRVLIFAILFLIALLALHLSRDQVRSLISRFILIGVGGGILFLPWFIHIFGGKIMSTLAQQISTPASQITDFTQQYNTIGNLSLYLSIPIWLVFVLASGWGLWRREKGAAVTVLWSFLVLLAANPEWVRLPGTGAIGNLTTFIAAYIPASIITGGSVGWLVEEFQSFFSSHEPGISKRTPRSLQTSGLTAPLIQNAGYFLLLVIIAGAGLWGARLRIRDVSPAQNSLVTRPDIRAAAWIRANTPQNARFLVNSFFAYGGAIVVGSDGGWWLPLLTGRQSSLPPITYVSEGTPRPDYRQWVNDLTEQVRTLGVNNPGFLDDLKERGITYIYIGQRQGRVNSSGPFLEPDQILQNPHFQTVYHQDQVWIFAVNQ
jgi:hypothetical protein